MPILLRRESLHDRNPASPDGGIPAPAGREQSAPDQTIMAALLALIVRAIERAHRQKAEKVIRTARWPGLD
jgi:hypothetical protein